MEDNYDAAIVSRFEEDIENIDEILLVAAEILFNFEQRLNAGGLDIDEFAALSKGNSTIKDLSSICSYFGLHPTIHYNFNFSFSKII